MTDETISTRPLPKRPANGLLAWQATIGYISAEYSLDAMLTIQVYPTDDGSIAWSAIASWANVREEVHHRPTVVAALRDLWREVDRNHVIFESREALIKRPVNYGDNEWLDADTTTILSRIIRVTAAVYGLDWMLMLVYQPVENPETRFQARLLALQNSVQIGGWGTSLLAACRDLYRNAVQHYSASGKTPDEV